VLPSPLRWPLAALPAVAVAGRFPLDDRDFAWEYRSPTHALHVYRYHGEIRFADGPPVPLRPGDWTVSPAGRVTRYHLAHPGHHWCVHFWPARRAGERCDLPLHGALGASEHRMVEGIARIAALLTAPGPPVLAAAAAAAASAALQGILLGLASLAVQPAPRPGPSPIAARAADHLDAHLGDALAVPDLARRLGVSPNWLAVVFRRTFGMTLQRYLLGRRIEHAQILLRTTDLPIGRIAARLGFSDAQHFDKRFRRVAGCTPSAYRAPSSGGPPLSRR
jgi:AraC-like DNA-binding protein